MTSNRNTFARTSSWNSPVLRCPLCNWCICAGSFTSESQKLFSDHLNAHEAANRTPLSHLSSKRQSHPGQERSWTTIDLTGDESPAAQSSGTETTLPSHKVPEEESERRRGSISPSRSEQSIWLVPGFIGSPGVWFPGVRAADVALLRLYGFGFCPETGFIVCTECATACGKRRMVDGKEDRMLWDHLYEYHPLSLTYYHENLHSSPCRTESLSSCLDLASLRIEDTLICNDPSIMRRWRTRITSCSRRKPVPWAPVKPCFICPECPYGVEAAASSAMGTSAMQLLLAHIKNGHSLTVGYWLAPSKRDPSLPVLAQILSLPQSGPSSNVVPVELSSFAGCFDGQRGSVRAQNCSHLCQPVKLADITPTTGPQNSVVKRDGLTQPPEQCVQTSKYRSGESRACTIDNDKVDGTVEGSGLGQPEEQCPRDAESNIGDTEVNGIDASKVNVEVARSARPAGKSCDMSKTRMSSADNSKVTGPTKSSGVGQSEGRCVRNSKSSDGDSRANFVKGAEVHVGVGSSARRADWRCELDDSRISSASEQQACRSRRLPRYRMRRETIPCSTASQCIDAPDSSARKRRRLASDRD